VPAHCVGPPGSGKERLHEHQMQKCLFDYLRAKKHAPRDQKPDVSVGGGVDGRYCFG